MVATHQQAEAVVETLRDVHDRERAHTRRRELDGERNSIEALADLGDRGFVGFRGLEGRLGRMGAIDEEARGFLGVESGDRVGPFARDAQRLAARSEDLEIGAGGEELLRDLGGGGQDVLAVVEDQQHPAFPHVRLERFHQ
jgi:hypothetical protein